MNPFRYKILLLLIIINNIIAQSQNITDFLYEEKGWKFIYETTDSILFYTKDIIGMELPAMKVDKIIHLDPHLVKNVIMDIEEYSEILSSADALKTKQLFENNNYIDAYQHITIDIPFFSNRHYFFRMLKHVPQKNNMLLEWYLLNDNNSYSIMLNDEDPYAIYINYGAGIWLAERIDNKKFIFSYRLFMDPGGYIPSFMINIINESSIINLFNDAIGEAKRRVNK